MFRVSEEYECRDFRIEAILKNLKEREQRSMENRSLKASITEKVFEMGMDINEFKALLRKKSGLQ